MNQKRVCGSCKACCTALIVDEVPKAEWERCRHLGGLGCKIYSKRPGSCRNYACGWLQGIGGRDDRPDRLGVIVSPVVSEQMGEHALLHEVAPGATQKPRVRQLVAELVKHIIVFKIERDSMRRLIGGPTERIRPLMEQAREAGVLTIDGVAPPPDVPLEQVMAEARARKAAT